MKRNIFKTIILALGFLMTANDMARAGESYNISVSCTIPAIPGVNVPPFNTKENTQAQGQTTEALIAAAGKETKKDSPQNNVIVEETQNPDAALQTVYDR